MARKPYLTRKADGQVFPTTRPRKVFKPVEVKGDKVVTPTLGAYSSKSEYNRIKKEKDMFRRKMYFAAFLASQLKKIGVESILVGGSAIELYTAGRFETADLDFVVTDAKKAMKLLKRMGFEKTGSVLFNRELGIAVDVSEKEYSGDIETVRKLRIRNYRLQVAGVEDLIVNRLYSAKYWKSNTRRDIEESEALLRVFADSINYEYLTQLALKNDVNDLLARVKRRTRST